MGQRPSDEEPGCYVVMGRGDLEGSILDVRQRLDAFDSHLRE